MGFLKGPEDSLEVPIGMGKKMQFVKIELTLNFVISSGTRNSEFHKHWYYQSVLAQRIINNISRTLSRTRDNTAVHTLPFSKCFFLGQLQRDEYFSVNDSYQETAMF